MNRDGLHIRELRLKIIKKSLMRQLEGLSLRMQLGLGCRRYQRVNSEQNEGEEPWKGGLQAVFQFGGRRNNIWQVRNLQLIRKTEKVSSKGSLRNQTLKPPAKKALRNLKVKHNVNLTI